jgi:tetratricopeptide (TPR) repeat protein
LEEFGGFEPLDIESSEGVHALPLDDTYVDAAPSLIEAAPAPALPMMAPEEQAPEPRVTSAVLANSVDLLRDRCEAAPEDWGLRRQLAEALLDDGQRDAGVAELESTLAGFERDGDLDTAASVAEEIVRIAPTVIRYHQKRVEFAFRASDRMRLAEAYVELADALVKDGQAAKARVVYQRVLEIAPDDIRAQAALETIAEAPATDTPPPRRSTTTVKKAAPAPAKPAAKKPAEDEFISLGDWLRDEEEPKSTRMVVEEKEPTGDEQADFADMLRKFKQGVSANVDEEDHEAHYDLGVAYKEMGLLDEAISEFQKSLRGPKNRVRAIEALGQCFVEKVQLPVAATILQRALAEPGVSDDSLVGVLYLLGTISEELDLLPDAKTFYERVFAVDIQFRDIGDRLNAVEKRLK